MTRQKNDLEKSISEADFREMWQGLSHNQRRFAVAMLDATTKSEAAKAVGLEPNTVYGWNGEINQVVAFMQTQVKDAVVGILGESGVKAAMVKVAGLDSGDEIRRQDAATEILDRVLGRPTQHQQHKGTVDVTTKGESLNDGARDSAEYHNRAVVTLAETIRTLVAANGDDGESDLGTAERTAVDGGAQPSG